MRTLKKMTIGELQIDSNEILERERMKAIKGGGGNCYVYCSGGTWGIISNCDNGASICDDHPFTCDCY